MIRARDIAAATFALAAISCAHPTPTVTPGASAAAVPAAAEGSVHAPAGSKLPPIAPTQGPLALRVQYPGPNDIVDPGDSSFILGSTGSGDAQLTINGAPVAVAPNGAWLAWLPFPRDSVMEFRLAAHTPRDSAELVYLVRRPVRPAPPTGPLWIDTTSIAPRGRVWARPDDYLTVRVRATEGSMVRVRLPGGGAVTLAADPRTEEVPDGIRAFDRDTGNLRRPLALDRYVGLVRPRTIGVDPGPVVGPPPEVDLAADTEVALIEAIRGADTARVRWPIRLALLDTAPAVVRFDDDTAGRGMTDSLTIGRTLPGGTYTWFFPTGTRATVLGRNDDDLHVRLSADAEAWVPTADAQPLPHGTPPPRGVAGSITTTPGPASVTLRIPLGERVPFRIEEGERLLSLVLLSTVGDVNWIRYGRADSLVRGITWHQPAADQVRIDVQLGPPVWGYRTRWDRNDLLFEVRRPPAIDPAAPLKGRLIVLDPGHPPGGATGPTGFREAEANLGIALQLRPLLEEAGAKVIMTRTRDTSIDLVPRTQLAERADAELLVSIHNNALPDGVNPFTNNGSSVFYNHLPSVPLAQAVQRGLVERLGLRDLGAARGDLALVRPTWMPSILSEGLFMMVPEQEAALRNPLGQRLYAEGVLEGLRRYLREVAAQQRR